MPESAALIVLVPAPTAVAEPAEDTVATAVAEEDQVAEDVRFSVDPSLYVPVAVNCWLWPTASEVAPVTAIDWSVGGGGFDMPPEGAPLLHPTIISGESIIAQQRAVQVFTIFPPATTVEGGDEGTKTLPRPHMSAERKTDLVCSLRSVRNRCQRSRWSGTGSRT